jgi:hypothetical protein
MVTLTPEAGGKPRRSAPGNIHRERGMANKVTKVIPIVEIEQREDERWLHLRMPLPEKRVVLVTLAVIGVGLILRAGLVDPETAKSLIRLLTTGTP